MGGGSVMFSVFESSRSLGLAGCIDHIFDDTAYILRKMHSIELLLGALPADSPRVTWFQGLQRASPREAGRYYCE